MAESGAENLFNPYHQPALQVPLLSLNQEQQEISEISQIIDTLPRHSISYQPWPVFPYRPMVSFTLAYTTAELYLKYYVTEQFLRASYYQPNDPVYKDSCVEFFISFNNETAYYNLEFNVLGTCRAGFGPERENRLLLNPGHIVLIRSAVCLKSTDASDTDKGYYWELTIAIPVTVFSQHTFTSFKGLQARGNFYKCGDDLPHPHFLTWNYVAAPQPNFHLSAFFGDLVFE